jgi:hypothetical protein
MSKSINKNKGGRPKTVLSQKQIEEVSELSQSLTIEQIADYLGVGQTTFYEIQKRQPEVSVAYKKGKQKAIKWVSSKLMDKIEQGDTASILFYLKTQAGWSEKQYMDINQTTSMTLQPIILNSNNKTKNAATN